MAEKLSNEVVPRKSRRLDEKRGAPEIVNRDYVLDRKRALEKKMISCLSDVKVSYTLKEQNHIYCMSTAMYELYKSETIGYYQSRVDDDRHKFKVKVTNITDSSNAHVETQIKVHQKTSRGCGHVKFTVNLYHTTNRVMVNGKNTDLFLKDHELIVKSILRKEEVESLDRKIFAAVKSELNQINCESRSVPCPSKGSKKTVNGSIGYNESIKSNGHQAEMQIVNLTESADEDSVAEALDYCPWCKERVGDGICCDQCLQWYHFNCENLSEPDFDNIQSDQPFFCKSCQLENSTLLSESLIQGDLRNDEADLKEASPDTTLGRSDTHATGILNDVSAQQRHNHQVAVEADAVPSSQKQTVDVIHHDAPPGPDGIYPHPLTSDGKQQNVVKQQEKPIPDKCYGKTLGTDPDKAPVMPKPGSPQKKPSKPKRGKKADTPHDNDDQLKLAQTYIVSLERKNCDLQDSVNLLKQELNMVKVEATGNNEKPQHHTASAVNSGNITYSEANALRERLSSIELELVKTRMSSLEHLVTRMSTPPPPPLPLMQYPLNNVPYPHGFGYQPGPLHLLQPHMQVQNPFLSSQMMYHAPPMMAHQYFPAMSVPHQPRPMPYTQPDYARHMAHHLQGQSVRIAPSHTQQNYVRIDRERDAQLRTNEQQGPGAVQRPTFVGATESPMVHNRPERPAHHDDCKKQPPPPLAKTPQQHLDELTSSPLPACSSPATSPGALRAPSTETGQGSHPIVHTLVTTEETLALSDNNHEEPVQGGDATCATSESSLTSISAEGATLHPRSISTQSEQDGMHIPDTDSFLSTGRASHLTWRMKRRSC